MITIVNLTPHSITIPTAEGPWTVESSGIARAVEDVTPGEPIAGIPTSRVRYTGVVDLPDATAGVYYVVSTITAQAASSAGRTVSDLLTPGEQVRDDKGRVVGCRSLVRHA